MKPVIALVGRPNVGKSTLFNCLTRSRNALVADYPGLTRDRQYGEGEIENCPFIVIDTGGLSGQAEGIDTLMADQVWQAVEEATVVMFIVDAQDGLVAYDEEIANRLRRTNKSIVLVVNKMDGVDYDSTVADFYSLGLGEVFAISAAHRKGVTSLIESVLDESDSSLEEEAPDDGIKIAIVGRPNVGKSTLVNRIIGEQRVVACDMPGTTRDSIFVPFERDDKKYIFIDTAGIRRRGKIDHKVEKFSVVKALQAIESSNVVVHVIDAQEGVTDQDAHLLGFVIETGRSLVVTVNKWDGLSADQRDTVKSDLERKLQFVNFAKLHFISALHGSGVGNIFKSILRAYEFAIVDLATPVLTRILEDAVQAHPPPLVKGRRVKLRYAHQGGKNPPIIVIHGNQTENVSNNYRRYLNNTFREVLRIEGTPLRIEFKTGANPFQGNKNTLNARQIAKKKRLKKYAKKKRN